MNLNLLIIINGQQVVSFEIWIFGTGYFGLGLTTATYHFTGENIIWVLYQQFIVRENEGLR